MATEKQIDEQVVEAYILYNKMVNEADSKIRIELEKQYNEAEEVLERLEGEFNQ